jgi:beta-phosphoglucomutase-like phosphatase (HAD superfamily)
VTSVQVTAAAGREAEVSAILFDLDGVLVDSLRVVERAWRRWAREQDLPADDVLAVVHGRVVPEVLVTAEDVTFGKPDPEPYRRAAAALGVPEAQCAVVGDAPMGVLAAKRAGMTVLAVTTTHPAAALARADLVFPGMAAVSGWLGARAADGRAR